MRVTNMMTSNQLLLNLNKSMNTLNFLQYQSATGNKIRYASDNPIIAGRSLKFRTNIVETEQFISNVDQGRSWMQTSANAVKNILEAFTNSGETSIRSLLVSVGDANTLSDRKIYANQLSETLNELLLELNASYAGRYVFSGYKTDEKPILGESDPNRTVTITQSFDYKDIQADYRIYTKNDDLLSMPEEISCNRLKLAYDSGIDPDSFVGFNVTPISSTDPLAYKPGDNDVHFIEDTGELIFGDQVYADLRDMPAMPGVASPNTAYQTFDNITVANASTQAATAKTQADALVTSLSSQIAALELASPPENQAVISKLKNMMDLAQKASDAADAVSVAASPGPVSQSLIDDAKTAMQAAYTAMSAGTNSNPLTVTYTKTGFAAGEINPKAYFTCVEDGETSIIDGQYMRYEFGINNKMAVNTLAKDLVPTALINDIKDMIKLIEGITPSDKDDLISSFMTIDGLSYEDAEERANKQLEDENKFYMDMIGNKCTKLIGKVDKHTVTVSRENTSIGSRISRLDLIYNRLQDDRINYEELKSDNDYVDAAEAYIKYQSMLSVYTSALQTGAKIIQMSLVNYV